MTNPPDWSEGPRMTPVSLTPEFVERLAKIAERVHNADLALYLMANIGNGRIAPEYAEMERAEDEFTRTFDAPLCLALLAEVVRLREALAPFGEKGHALADGRLISSESHKTIAIIVSKNDIRRAAALLPAPSALSPLEKSR